jgi:hypothetical protein
MKNMKKYEILRKKNKYGIFITTMFRKNTRHRKKIYIKKQYIDLQKNTNHYNQIIGLMLI